MDLLGAIFIVVVAILVVASVSLGIFLARMGTRNNQGTQTQANAPTGNNAQLDRIEKSIREGIGIGIIALSVAAIVTAGTVGGVAIGWKLLLYCVGAGGIIYSIIRFGLRR